MLKLLKSLFPRPLSLSLVRTKFSAQSIVRDNLKLFCHAMRFSLFGLCALPPAGHLSQDVHSIFRVHVMRPSILLVHPNLNLSSSFGHIGSSKRKAAVNGIRWVRSLGIHGQNSLYVVLLTNAPSMTTDEVAIPHSLQPDKAPKVQGIRSLGFPRKYANLGSGFTRQRDGMGVILL